MNPCKIDPAPALDITAWEARMGAQAALEKNKEARVYLQRLTREIKAAKEKARYEVSVPIPKSRLANNDRNRIFVTGVMEALRDNRFTTEVCCVKKGGEKMEIGRWSIGILDRNPEYWADVKSAELKISWHSPDPND